MIRVFQSAFFLLLLAPCLLVGVERNATAQSFNKSGQSTINNPKPNPPDEYDGSFAIGFNSTHYIQVTRTDSVNIYVQGNWSFLNGHETTVGASTGGSFGWGPFDISTKRSPTSGTTTINRALFVGTGTWTTWAKTKWTYTDYGGTVHDTLVTFNSHLFKVIP